MVSVARERRQPAHTMVSRKLGVAIVTGVYPPGSVLPGEFEIVEQQGVSRSVVREALRMLAAKGLVESKPKLGTRVRDRRAWNTLDPDVLEWMFEGEPPATFVKNLFELRLMVEPAAAELAATKRSAGQISVMGHALERMALHSLQSAEGQVADQQFHAAILEATDNDLIINLAAIIGAAVRWTTLFKIRKTGRPRDPIGEHRRLFEAIVEGDGAKARAATIELIQLAEQDTQAVLQEPQRTETKPKSGKGRPRATRMP
ncbi:FadR family transcriptional regulator [Novosphingobium profundi]|uniref:FadR/GntR family transcriptional regulator n=1 Tax=Novosphingobium profundi TaxID=1774954 RepID=UPI001BDAA55C|nr:FadR/GntR family transcriptional regulator [Novosphingobium profundi]MBT0669345.1 FadR family transcriptional regulator [Novosphingobium profundi]